MRSSLTGILALAFIAACSTSKSDDATTDTTAAASPDSARLVASPTGFTEPEAVRYDPDQDVYFVTNWGKGDPAAKDNNGAISRMTPDGVIAQLRFIAGGAGGVTLHSPRGMTIVGDTLWAVDPDAVRGFNRRTGAPVATVDFSAHKLGFLNDIAAGPDGLYVTDTGTDRIYRISGRRVTVALADTAIGNPNGITWDGAGRRFIVVPWEDSVIKVWTPGSKTERPSSTVWRSFRETACSCRASPTPACISSPMARVARSSRREASRLTSLSTPNGIAWPCRS
jgi:sugar lactone lactonase YvrE